MCVRVCTTGWACMAVFLVAGHFLGLACNITSFCWLIDFYLLAEWAEWTIPSPYTHLHTPTYSK